jgi:RNA polymerase sigma-70 factor (sigma-E family)
MLGMAERAADADLEIEDARKDPLERLYRLHVPDCIRLAFLLTGDRALAEDIGQEAFVRTMGRFHDLRNRDSLGWYLRRAVVNLSYSHFRRAGRERRYLQRIAHAPAEPQPDLGARQEMWEQLLSLPERQRAALVLRFYEDLTEAQTAEVLGCPVGTVKSLVSRGLGRLRGQMGVERETRHG